MKITRRQLRQIIADEISSSHKRRLTEARFVGGIGFQPVQVKPALEEGHGGCGCPSEGEMPCPHSTAEKILDAGAPAVEVMRWLSDLVSDLSAAMGDFSIGSEEQPLDLEDMPGPDAFGVGYMAGGGSQVADTEPGG
tara:strand:- start:1631 stop:2041 length:411 start_codon:yes stop_codon:yes gene_type:complete